MSGIEEKPLLEPAGRQGTLFITAAAHRNYVMLHALAALVFTHLHMAASATCEPLFCHNVPCSPISRRGDNTIECGMCGDDARCHPGAIGLRKGQL